MKQTLPALAVLAVLTACATTASLPPTTGPLNANVKLVMYYEWGVGDYATSYGVNQIEAQTQAKYGAQVQTVDPVTWTAYGSIAAAMSAVPKSVKVGVMGYSCGGSTELGAASQASRSVALVEGVQVSPYCPPYFTTLAANVQEAVEVYNPVWVDTLGLGSMLWQCGTGFNCSNFTAVERDDSHPYAALDPDTQADMVAAVATVLKPAAAMMFGAARGSRVPGAFNHVLRHAGQPLF